MATFNEFKTSVVDSVERVVKRLVQKLKSGEIVVMKAEESKNSLNSLNSAKLENKTLQEIIDTIKTDVLSNSNKETFETLSKNLKALDATINYSDTGKIVQIEYDLGAPNNHKIYKDFGYFSDGRIHTVTISSTSYELNSLLKNNKKEYIYIINPVGLHNPVMKDIKYSSSSSV